MTAATSAPARLPGAFWVVWTGTLVNRLGTFIEPFAVLYLTQQRGLSPAAAGVVVAAYGAGAVGAQLVGGWSADRFGRRRTMVLALCAAAAALLGLGAARGTGLLLVLAFLVGLAGDGYRPAASALVADLVGPADRARAFGLVFWAANLGFSGASAAGGWLAGYSWDLLFVLDAATCLAYAVVVAVGIRRDPPRTAFDHSPAAGSPARDSPGQDSPGPARGSGYRVVLADRLFLAVVALTVGHATLYTQTVVTLPLEMAVAGLSPAQFGTALALNGVLIVVLQPVAVRWLPRFDHLRVLAVGQLTMAVGFALTAFAAGLAGFAATVAVWTLGEVVSAGFLAGIAADLAPAEARGRYQGTFGFGFGVAALVAPLVGLPLWGAVGGRAVWLGTGAAGVAVAAAFLALSAPVARRRAALHPPGGPGGGDPSPAPPGAAG